MRPGDTVQLPELTHSATPFSFRNAPEAHDLIAAQGLQEGLKAAVDEAAQDRAVDFHLAHSRRALDPLGGRSADETNFHALFSLLLSHVRKAMDRVAA